ncbi:MAG: mechanosensitive ion channel family protein [Vulcanimicrobiaceae bacterium]
MLAIAVIACNLVTFRIADAQLIPGITLPSPAPNSATGVRQEGIYTTAPILLDGSVLFRIAAPVTPSADQLPITVRASYVQSELTQVLAVGEGAHATTVYDPKTLKVQLRNHGNQALLQVVDAKHTEPLPILTVTSVDAKYHQLTVDALAGDWQEILQAALEQGLLKRQPAVVKRSFDIIARVGAGLILASLLIWAIVAPLRRKIGALAADLASRERSLADQQPDADGEQPEPSKRRRRFLAIAIRAVDPAQRLALFRALAATLLWLLVLAWFGAVTWGFLQFAPTTPLALTIVRIVVGLASIWIVTGLLNRILDVVIARVAAAWRVGHFSSSEERARQLLRIPTVARALGGFKTFVLVFVAALATLGEIGIPISSVVTIGGLLAIGVTLAAQNFVRDFVNGFLVLFEDQYVVGDYIALAGHSGLVENLSLRMVQIRDGSGDLITIPHNSVTTVVNQSRNWSRVDYRVSIDAAADVPRAVELIRVAIDELAHDPASRDEILDPLEWIGVDALSRDGVIVRACMRTAPLRQFKLRRLLNERVRAAFAEAGIAYGAPIP